MECPNCGLEIDKNALACPNCKKVFKIICPSCKTVNEQNICKKCGEILVSKCIKCGKINLSKDKNCPKCGYPTAYSAIAGDSLTDKFAVLKIEFPNSNIIKDKLGSNKLYNKFKTNFDYMIVKFLQSQGLRRQIYKGDIYVIRFNKTYTLKSSADTAIKTVIELINLFARLNVKLLNRTSTVLKCNLTIMQKSANGNPDDISTGYRVNMLGQNSNLAIKTLDSIQILTDDDFYEFYNLDYKLEGLDSAPVNGKMKRFYEINLKEFIKVSDFIEEDSEENESEEIPDFIQNAIENQENTQCYNPNINDDLYNIDLINFEEVNCKFESVENIRILEKIKENLKKNPKSITTIRGEDIYQPYTIKLLSVVNELEVYQNIIPITCNNDMQFTPYSFFRELISTVFEYCTSQKLFSENDFSMFENTNSSDIVKDLINLSQRDMKDIYETRSKYFNIFLDLFRAIPNTLLYIENFEKIDNSSLFVLTQLFEHFEDLEVSYLISYDKNYALHKNSPFLLSMPHYNEINLIPASFDTIISEDYDFYKNVLNDFYFQKVAKYDKGSILFLDFVIQYLIELGIYSIQDDSLLMINAKTAVIPSSVGRLIQRRLNLIKNKNILKFLTMCILLGTRIDIKTAQSFGFENWEEIANQLYERGFLYFYNNCIYFSNYNILKQNLLGIISQKDLKEIAKDLYEQTFIEEFASPVKAFLYEILNEHQKVIFEWEKLANINLSMGDFSSYINCSQKILDALDKYATDWSNEDLEKYKVSLYENISGNMFDYNPKYSSKIAQQTLNCLGKDSDKKKFIEFCTKMIQGSVNHGEFLSAQNLTHKVLSVMEDVSINPNAENFDFNYLLISILRIKILFNMGEYNECISLGYNILNVLDSEKIEKIDIHPAFKDELIDNILQCIAFIALSNIILLKEDVEEFLKISKTLFDFVPEEYSIFVELQNLIRSKEVNLSQDLTGKNIFAEIFYHIIKAFIEYPDKPRNFAGEIYKAKIASQCVNLINFELFTDLLIGYSYTKLNYFKKASSILTEVEKTAKEKGLLPITHICAYIMSILNIKQYKYDVAYGLLANSDIQMDKKPISEYFVLLNKFNMYKVLICKGFEQQAQICLEQAEQIIKRYNLNINLNIDIEKIMKENQGVDS